MNECMGECMNTWKNSKNKNKMKVWNKQKNEVMNEWKNERIYEWKNDLKKHVMFRLL